MQNPLSLDHFDQNAFLVSLQQVNQAKKSWRDGQKFVLVMNVICFIWNTFFSWAIFEVTSFESVLGTAHLPLS